jgi:hypothetical protein
MVTNPIDGKRYLTIKTSIENESHGDDRPRKPWWGQLKIMERTGGTVMILNRVRKGDDSIDHDSNASAYVRPEDLFNGPDNDGSADTEYRRRLSAWALARLEESRVALMELAAKE